MSTYKSSTSNLEKLNIIFLRAIKLGNYKYDLYNIDKTQYPYIKCDKVFIEAKHKNSEVIVIPRYTPVPEYNIYGNDIFISFDSNNNLIFNNAKSICSQPCVDVIKHRPSYVKCYTSLIYNEHSIRNTMKVSLLNNKNVLKDTYHIGLLQHNIKIINVVCLNDKFPYYLESGTIRASHIPMLKHGYTNVYIISKSNESLDLDLTLEKPKSFIYDTFVYGHVLIDMNNSVIDVISQLSKSKDNKIWLGFEDIKILTQ